MKYPTDPFLLSATCCNDISDILLPNIHIDVRVVVDENQIYFQWFWKWATINRKIACAIFYHAIPPDAKSRLTGKDPA